MGALDLLKKDTANEQTPPVENADIPPVDPEKEAPVDPAADPEVPAEEPVVQTPFVPHGEVDPSFNCVPCKGEGLDPVTQQPCQSCGGTGKEKVE